MLWSSQYPEDLVLLRGGGWGPLESIEHLSRDLNGTWELGISGQGGPPYKDLVTGAAWRVKRSAQGDQWVLS